MKNYSDTELQKKAEEVFQANPKVEKLLVTSDGQCFFPEKKNAAHFHAKSNGGLKIHEIERPAKSEKAKAKSDEEEEVSNVKKTEDKADPKKAAEKKK